MNQGYSMGGKIAARRMKKWREQEKRAAKKRLQDAIEGTYVDPDSGCTVTVLKRAYAYGAGPEKGVSQRDYQRVRAG
jgi:hypothetical protein